MKAPLRERIAAIPSSAEPLVEPPAVRDAIAASEAYLASNEAIASLERDPYWPKWDAPWWHMLALFELGEAGRIPSRVANAMVATLDAMPVKVFPIHPGDVPPGIDRHRHTSCHCALGTMGQVLEACGIDVAAKLPWVMAWFPKYQMRDGGLSCDGDAYLVDTECASSMVGTVAPFELLSGGDPKTWSADRAAFVDRAAAFLVDRALWRGSASKFNAEEREREAAWKDLAFPRFYFYDVLRGLHALVAWADRTEATLPLAAVGPIATMMCDRFPDGVVTIGRQAHAGMKTHAPTTAAPDGPWHRTDASTFALLDAASAIGAPSPSLTRSWAVTRERLLRLFESDRLAS